MHYRNLNIISDTTNAELSLTSILLTGAFLLQLTGVIGIAWIMFAQAISMIVFEVTSMVITCRSVGLCRRY